MELFLGLLPCNMQYSTFTKTKACFRELSCSHKNVSGPSQDEIIEYLINDTKLQYVSVWKLGNNEMFASPGDLLDVKVAALPPPAPHEIIKSTGLGLDDRQQFQTLVIWNYSRLLCHFAFLEIHQKVLPQVCYSGLKYVGARKIKNNSCNLC